MQHLQALLQKAQQVRAAASQAQHQAADPQVSVFVNANAGSGKTYLLVNRVIRLLLTGVQPENILCITYTRAAATEMRTRLFERLAEWIHLDDGELLQRIHQQLDHRSFPQDALPRARRLFALALETPGGLRVQTIHAFCERLLQAFPVEAGMPPGFEVMDEAETRTLLDEARTRLLKGDDEKVRDDLALLATHLSEQDLQDRLGALLNHRRLLARMHMGAQFEAFVFDNLRKLLAIDEAAPQLPQEWLEAWFDTLDHAALQEATDRLAALPERLLKQTDHTTIDTLKKLLRTASSAEAANLAMRLFLKQDGERRSERRWILTSKVRDAAPDAAALLRRMEEETWHMRQGLLARHTLQANTALLRVGKHVLSLYEQSKARLGKFDYDDLILRTLHLLRGEEGQWVLYRLDGRIDHILLDEAQDTSPEQWQILKAISEEFTAGKGARHEGRRTLFAVGDVKQSIYSFQGAAPQAFQTMRRIFEERFKGADLAFRAVPLQVSFRTVQPILDVVDKVLAQEDFRIGHDAMQEAPRHQSARPHVPGFVELWPLEQADDSDADTDEIAKADAMHRALEKLWRAPRSLDTELHPRLRLAARIADTIRHWLDNGEALPPDPEQARRNTVRTAHPQPVDAPRPIRPRDILVLVRNRTTLMEAIVSALKQRNIPVAGIDRLRVADHIAVQDMLALARFLLLPTDDLSLAAVLKSPLLARDDGQPFSDDDLLRLRGELFDFTEPLHAIARMHEEHPLWEQLQMAAQAGAPVRQAVAQLQRWRRMVGHVPAYELLAHVLWRDGGLKRFLQRLGTEALEPLEALLDLALQFERDNTDSLSAFVEWLQQESPEIKREQEGDADLPDDAPGAVRVMTVHGAKGLEAPVVFLADTTSVPDRRKIRLMDLPITDTGDELPLWPMKSAHQPQVVRDLVQRHIDEQEEEYNRLLYVAMTRAADRLYVCGAQEGHSGTTNTDDRKKHDGRIRNWHERIAAVLQQDAYAVQQPDGRTVWRYPPETPCCRRTMEATEEEVHLPPWTRQAAPTEPGPALWLSPSRLPRPGADEAADSAAQQGSTTDEPVLSPLSLARRRTEPLRDPFRRGILIHKLLQHMPDVPPAERTQRAMHWLMQPGRGLTREQAQALWAEVEQVLEHPEMRALFGPHARAEVPFATQVTDSQGRQMLISGQMDRLAVLDEEVIVADYKTARPVPQTEEEVPASYVRQLALYCHAARQIWPDKSVRGVLVYTAGPKCLKLSEKLLKQALATT